jgi:hypothetical protein
LGFYKALEPLPFVVEVPTKEWVRRGQTKGKCRFCMPIIIVQPTNRHPQQEYLQEKLFRLEENRVLWLKNTFFWISDNRGKKKEERN